MKVQTAFRLDKDLLDQIKIKAKKQKRSLNNYIEYLLYREVGEIPNEETETAIKDAKYNINMENIENIDTFLDSL